MQRSPGATLGDVLFSKPGITGSSFAPGASSRPIVRGLDVNRVGIVDNGVGAGGASDLGEDHFVPVNPLATGQIEVIRGPATLRYGSQAIGGVVSSTNNRIPEALPCAPSRLPVPQHRQGPPQAAPGCARPSCAARCRASTTAAKAACCSTPAPANFAFHADVFGRQTDDYRVPSYPYLVAPDPAELPFATQPGGFNGRQPNSSTRSNEASVGGSYLFIGGFAGMAYTRNDNALRHPGRRRRRPRHPHRRPPGQADRQGRVPAGAAAHRRDPVLVGRTPTTSTTRSDSPTPPIRAPTAFARPSPTRRPRAALEVQLAPFNLRFAELTTAIGVQAGAAGADAPGDDPASPVNGLFDPNRNNRVGRLHLQRVQVQRNHQGADRRPDRAGQPERHGHRLPRRGPDLRRRRRPDERRAGAPARSHLHAQERQRRAASSTCRGTWSAASPRNMSSARRSPPSCSRAARMTRPRPSTSAIPISRPRWPSRSKSACAARKGPFRFEVTAYYTRFDGFIFRRLTGNTCDEQSCIDPAAGDAGAAAGDLLPARRHLPRRRVPVPVGHACRCGAASWASTANTTSCAPPSPTAATCRASRRSGSAAASISAAPNGSARVSLLHAFAQNDIATVGETPTARLQSAEGRAQPHPGAEERPERHQAVHRRHGRQQPAQRGHPQPRVLHQGRGADAGGERPAVRQRKILRRFRRAIATTSGPGHAVARQHGPHRLDQLVLGHRELRLGLLLQILVAVLVPAGSSAPRIRSLICTSPFAFSSPPWMIAQGCRAGRRI